MSIVLPKRGHGKNHGVRFRPISCTRAARCNQEGRGYAVKQQHHHGRQHLASSEPQRYVFLEA